MRADVSGQNSMKGGRLSTLLRNRVTAILLVTIVSILSLAIVRALASAREGSRASFCVGNLRFLSTACLVYIDEHGGGRHFPTTLNDLLAVYPHFADRSRCLSDESLSATADGVGLSYTTAFDLAWQRRKLFCRETPSNMIMAWETRSGHHKTGARMVAYFGAYVKTLSEEGFRHELRRLQGVIDALHSESTSAAAGDDGDRRPTRKMLTSPLH